jgi:hypothetical protein
MIKIVHPVAGALNITLLCLNMRAGLQLTGKLRRNTAKAR